MDGNTILKLCSVFALAGFTILAGCVPFMIQGLQRGVKWPGVANCFAGGIFMAVGMLHMLPEAHEQLEHTFGHQRLPFAFLLTLFTYALILLLEKVCCNVHKHEQDKKCDLQREIDERSQFDSEAEERLFKNLISKKPQLAQLGTPLLDRKDSEPHTALPSSKNATSSYLLLSALSVHSVFEGIAIGVQSDITKTIRLMIAILIHKLVAALALGISFQRANASRGHFIKIISFFAIATPMGATFGLLISTQGIDGAEGICNALAVGTFIYMGASEIIVEEFSVSKHTVLKYVFFVLGLLIIAGLMLLDEHDHDHGAHAHDHSEHIIN